MKRCLSLAVGVALIGSVIPVSAVMIDYYTWTGASSTGWRGPVTPPNDGTANLVFGDNVSTFIPIPSPDFNISSMNFTSDNRFLFVPQSTSSVLNIGSGGMTASNQFNSSTIVDFASGVTVNLTSSQTWNFGSGGGAVMIHGVLGGSGNLTLTGSNNYNSPTLNLVSQTPNANIGYTGSITLGNSTVANLLPAVVLWASGNLGTGSLTFVNGGQLITHNTTAIPNNLVLNTGPLPGGNNYGVFTPVSFRAWDAPMNLTGSVTLANNTTINAQVAPPDIPSLLAGNTGSWPLAGPLNRNPILFSGRIGESGGARSLNIIGPGVVIFAGANSIDAYSGGTNVGFISTNNQPGTLIFANLSAIPGTPTTNALQSGLLNTAGASGYIGIADTAVSTAGTFNTTFLAKFVKGSSGAVGIDSLTGLHTPDSTPHTFSDNIDLSTFTTTGNLGIRFGTATSLIFTGTIIPQLPNVYHFGNGGGRLYLQTALADQPSVTSSVRVVSQDAFPLQLFLQGNNTYSSATLSTNSIVIFDGANSIPATTTLTASGDSTNIGGSYIGYTENAGINGGAIIGSNHSDFLAKIHKASTWGIIGFDTTNLGAPAAISNLSLTGFNNGVFIGTNSAATLSGTITPTADNILRLTATSGGILTVGSALAPPLSVVLGSPAASPAFSDGKVILNGTNTHSGGTVVNSIGNLSIVAGSSAAFGTGNIALMPHKGVLALSAGTTGVNLPNAIVFGQATPMNGYTPVLNLTGSNDFTLSGNISGPDRTAIYTQNDVGQGVIALNNVSPVNVTVSGNNSGFYGTFLVQNGTMTFASDNAPGHAQVQMNGSAANVAFTSANPVVYGLWNGDADGGTVTLGASTNLKVDTTQNDLDYDFDFGGHLVGGTGSALTLYGTVNPAADTEFFYLYGTSPSFSGNVYVTGQSALAVGQNNSAGTGPITLSATEGGIALNKGVSLTNPLVFNTGALAGIGTFQPSTVSGTGQTAGKITFGASQLVYPGIPGENYLPGKLTLATDVAFANGGKFALTVQDPAATEDGFGSLNITGSLNLTAISTGGFAFKLETVDSSGNNASTSTIVYGNSYSLRVITATGGIVGYNDPLLATKFTFDSTKFQNGFIPAAFFSITADANNLYLNFTAVPEPSTWALLITGAGFLSLAAWRRRRA